MDGMKILIVDDEKLARLNIMSQLDSGFSVQEATSFESAVTKLNRERFDICYIDLKLDDSAELHGLKLISLATSKGIYTVVMTSIEDEAITELAYEYGCQDVYNKGHEKAHISETLSRFFLSKESFTEDYLFKDVILTQNKKYKDELKRLLKIIPTEIPLCILGESGTGKSYLAKSIHELSKRKGKFIELNCSTFNGDTLKTELFGHAKGSFTGAVTEKTGKLAEANHGTLFLDEIGSMGLEMQEALLKVIEEKSFYPVGSNKMERSEFRVICATLDDLESMIKSGKFRFDLFQRISGYTFTQPALRNRPEDILPLLKSKLQSSRKIIFKEEAKRVLESYEWPGNIRELSRFAEVISVSQSGVIKASEVESFMKSSQNMIQRKFLHPDQYELIKKMGLREFLDVFSRQVIEMALSENDGKARKAISELQISSATFYKYYDKDSLNPILMKPQQTEHEYGIH